MLPGEIGRQRGVDARDTPAYRERRMFRIKKRNRDALIASVEQALEARMIRRLRDHFEPMRSKSDEDLRAFVRLGKERALAYGVCSPYGISLYVGIMAELGADFDTAGAHPWPAELLQDKQMIGNDKVEFICEHVFEMNRATQRTGSR